MAINPFNLNTKLSSSTQDIVKNKLTQLNQPKKNNLALSVTGTSYNTPSSKTQTTTQMYKPTQNIGMSSATNTTPTVVTPQKTNTQQNVNTSPAMQNYVNTVYPQNNTGISTPNTQTYTQQSPQQSQMYNNQQVETPLSPNNDAMSAYLAQYSQSIAEQNKARLEKANIENKQKEAQVKAYEAYNKKLDESGQLLSGARQAATNIERRAGITDQQYALEKLAASNLLSALTQNQQANQPIEIGDKLIDPSTGAIIFTKPSDGFSLSEGQQRFDSSGRLIASGSSKDEILSVAEAKSLGVPYGTTRTQAYGKSIATEEENNTLLTPTEASQLGVPYGTTRAQAFGASSNKPFSGEASKLLSITETVQPEIAQLKNAFINNYRGSLLGITSGTDRELVKLVDQVADKVGRLRSGGAINTDEATRFKKQIASFMDIPFGNSQQAINALDGILAEAQSVATSIRGGSQGTAPSTQSTGTTWADL